jgi:hypothetical protein
MFDITRCRRMNRQCLQSCSITWTNGARIANVATPSPTSLARPPRRIMSGPIPNAPDDARISTAAALVALGGHAVIILAALWLGAQSQTVVIAPSVVGVTLVSGAPGGAAASAPATPAATTPTTPGAAPRAPVPDSSTGERLDRLIAPDTTTAPSTSAKPDRSPDNSASNAAASSSASGSSRADQGLGQGESADGVDLYAAASLPNVGSRPASPPAGDLWKKVAPCWRSASPRKATLIVEIEDDGSLIGSPRAVRKASASADPQLLLAERAAVRAVQACAPYTGIGGRAWRVAFP